MKKQILLFLLALLTGIGTSAADFEVDGINYTRLTSSTVEVSGSSTTGFLTIPSSVTYDNTTYSVTSIGNRAFYYCSGLRSVVIPESVTSIEVGAFNNCTDLVSVSIPNSVASIGGSAFYNCTGLTSVVIPNSVTSIGFRVFYNCSSLRSVVIPNSVTSLGDGAFSNCTSLKSVVIPESVTSIGGSFSGCTGLTSVTIPESITSIGSAAFYNCIGLKTVTIPNSVTSIGSSAFSNCRNLESVTIGNSVTSIGEKAFDMCSNLTSITIPNSVTIIENYAFEDCLGLTSVTIGNSVTSIGSGAFKDCLNINSIDSKAEIPPVIMFDSFRGIDRSIPITVPASSIDKYKSATYWSTFTNYVISEIALEHGVAYTVTSDAENVPLTYARTFEATSWQPLYVPFNMSYDEWKDYADVAELACVHVYEDGRTTIEFVTLTEGELLPNVPYVIKPKAEGPVVFECEGKTLKAAPTEGSRYISCSSPRYEFRLYGNYQPISGSTLATYGAEFGGAYIIAADNKFLHASESSTLRPFSFYIVRSKNENGYWGAPAVPFKAPAETENLDEILIMVDGEVCGIADILIEDTEDGCYYNIKGQKVDTPHNGIYIHNGKKVIIK